jgi:long-subunit acyl-CoA synthetase (AMP-forming)
MRRTIFSMMADARSRFGEKPFAFRKTDAGWVSKTFNETFDEARLVASFLMDRGFTKGDRLAIYAEGSPNWIVAEYGIIAAGCIAVPLSFKLLPKRSPTGSNIPRRGWCSRTLIIWKKSPAWPKRSGLVRAPPSICLAR